jgi:hypothetical protein
MAQPDVATILSNGQAFESMCTALLSAEDGVRSPAESVFEQLKQHADPLIGNFLVVLRQSALVEHRQLAAVLLRKVGRLISNPNALGELLFYENVLAFEAAANFEPAAGAHKGRPPALGQVQRSRPGEDLTIASLTSATVQIAPGTQDLPALPSL